MSRKPAETCCTTFWTYSRTREDLLQDPEVARELDLAEWAPLVEWVDHIGAYSIGHAAIFYCPWCGTRLPDNSEDFLAEAKKSGFWVEVDADGQMTASNRGEHVKDVDALIARLRGPANDEA